MMVSATIVASTAGAPTVSMEAPAMSTRRTQERSTRPRRTLSPSMLSLPMFPATNWRDITSYTRLGLAAFLLSCPELSIGDVAKEVGYAHPTALTNAFADASLPAPSTLRELLDPGN
jgi:AraC-like DNA-binding protein